MPLIHVHPGVNGGGGGTPPGGTTYRNVTYTVDSTTDFLNPERGWMARDGEGVNNFATARNAQSGSNVHPIGYSVVWTNADGGSPWTGSSGNPFNLGNYQGTDTLPQSLLTELGNYFGRARSGGIKLKVRFFYNSPPSSYQRMIAHAGQLAPVLTANYDVVATLDAGLVGAWGEMAGSQDAIDAVTNFWLDNTPSWMTVATRMPRNVRSLYPSYNLPVASRFTTRQSRLGAFNDCFVSNPLQGATFFNETDRDTFNKATRFASSSGETCWPGSDYPEVHNAVNAMSEMAYVHMDLLFRQYYAPFYDGWISSGHYPEISRRLGYRLHLTSASLPATANSGGSVTVTINMTNTGYGKVYNPRPVDLVFSPTGGGASHTVRLSSDARRDLPLAGESQAMTYTFTLPSMPAGTYNTYLSLPDPSSGLAADERYSIRLANQNMWASGRNNLNSQLTIS